MVGKLTPTQRAAIKEHLAQSEPILVAPSTINPPEALPTRLLNRFIDWYSAKI